MLTGKCKEDFEKWLMKTFLRYSDPRAIEIERRAELNLFYAYDLSMQFGVIIDFFDSVDIEIRIEKDFIHTGSEVYYYNVFPSDFLNEFETTLNGARKKAIEKANEIYNENRIE